METEYLHMTSFEEAELIFILIRKLKRIKIQYYFPVVSRDGQENKEAL